MRSEVQGQTIDDGVHLDLAEDILKALFKDDMESASRHLLFFMPSSMLTNDCGDVEDDKKVLCQVLGRLHFPETVDDDKIRTVKLLVQNIFTVRSDSLLLPSSAFATPACSADQSGTSLHAMHSLNSTRRSARSTQRSSTLAKKNVDNSNSLKSCSSFWMTLYHLRTGRRWRCR